MSRQEKWGNLQFISDMRLIKTTIQVKLRLLTASLLVMTALAALAQNNVVEEVAWVIGDEPIFKSEIEDQYQQALYERVAIEGNPYCVIPEQMALDKLFLDQARIDTVEVQQSAISSEVGRPAGFRIKSQPVVHNTVTTSMPAIHFFII